MTAARTSGDLSVDIVIDNYNYGRFLPAAIESALAQTHPEVDVIVVDDGSSDDSRAVVGRYDEQVTVVLKANGGQASALNAGFERCRGDIVLFLDADDVLEPGTAAAVAAAFAADEALVKVQYRSRMIDAEGRPTGVVKPSEHLEVPNGDMQRAELAYPFDLVWMSTSANAFRRRALARIMPMPESRFRTCADSYLVHLTPLLGPVRSLTEVGVGYRLHGANSYEPQAAELDLEHVRDSVRIAQATADELLRLAAELGQPRPRQILSLADLANRMISLRLDPGQHPIATDSRRSLLAGAVGAVRRRANASAAMRLMFLVWFAAMALAPRPLARQLAVLFLFPERRTGLNGLLGRLQGDREPPAA